MKHRYRYKSFSDSEEIDPMGSLVNLFDVAMVFGHERRAEGSHAARL